MIPQLRFPEFTDDWQISLFEKYLHSVSSGKSKVISDGVTYEIYGSTGSIGKSKGYDYEGDNILIARVGANAGSMYRVRGRYKVSDNTLIISLNNADINFIEYSLNKFNISRLIFGSGQPLVTGTQLKKIKLAFPSKTEQEKIAEFLVEVDKRIKQIERKIELLHQYKKSVMQKIFARQIRFKGENGRLYSDWSEHKAGELFTNISNRQHNGDLPVLSVTQNGGVVRRDSLDKKIDQSDSGIQNYKIIEPNDFVISLRSFQGGIEKSDILGISSPAYTVLRGDKRTISEFFKHYFKREEFISRLNSTVIGIRDGKQISYEPFSTLKIPVPSVEEQQKIAIFLTAIDDKIKAEEMGLDASQQWKKGLLQRMFV